MDKRGFTLIELLVVMALITFISSFVLLINRRALEDFVTLPNDAHSITLAVREVRTWALGTSEPPAIFPPAMAPEDRFRYGYGLNFQTGSDHVDYFFREIKDVGGGAGHAEPKVFRSIIFKSGDQIHEICNVEITEASGNEVRNEDCNAKANDGAGWNRTICSRDYEIQRPEPFASTTLRVALNNSINAPCTGTDIFNLNSGQAKKLEPFNNAEIDGLNIYLKSRGGRCVLVFLDESGRSEVEWVTCHD